jgi:glycine hydroxymethyltransferase
VIAAKAVAFGEALTPEFKTYQEQVIRNAKTLADSLIGLGFRLVTNGTDNHLMLIDLSQSHTGEVTGKEAEAWLDLAGITVNKNTVPNEKRSPFITSGIRVGTPAMTTRGLREGEMKQIALWIRDAVQSKGDAATLAKIRGMVKELCARFPVYGAHA